MGVESKIERLERELDEARERLADAESEVSRLEDSLYFANKEAGAYDEDMKDEQELRDMKEQQWQ